MNSWMMASYISTGIAILSWPVGILYLIAAQWNDDFKFAKSKKYWPWTDARRPIVGED